MKLAHHFTAEVRQPDEGDEGKAVRRRGAPTALLFEQAQYKISKSKYAVSIMAVTLATESTNASRAS